MNPRERIEKIHVFLLIGGIFLFGLVILIIAATLGRHERELKFGGFIQNTDRLMQSEAYEEALTAIKNRKGFKESAGDWIRLLKRVRLISLRLNRPEIFSEISRLAVKAYPGNENLRALAVVALMDAGDYAGAGEWAEKYLQSVSYRAVKAEAFLRAGLGIKGPVEGALFLSTLPESREPEDFTKAAELTGEAGYFLDAALLLLEKGQKKEALEILTRPGIGDIHPFVTALALFDSGDYAGAESFLSRVIPDEENFPFIALLYSDLFLRTGRTERAKESYDAIRSAYSRISPIPYVNTGIILRPGDPARARSVLKQGLSLFPENPDIVFSLSKILLSLASPDESRSLLEAFENRYGKSGESELLQLFSRRDSLNTRQFVGELYLLRGLYPGNEDIDRIIIWHLLSIFDYPGIHGLLSSHGDKAWVHLYRGAISFARRDYRAAQEDFTRMLDIRENASGLYNLGISRMALREYGKALPLFLEAEKDGSITVESRSKLTAALSENYVRLGRYDAAQKTLQTHLRVNPGDARVLRILRKLEARPES